MPKQLISNPYMYNIYTKFIIILEICKQLSENLIHNITRRGPVPQLCKDSKLFLLSG